MTGIEELERDLFRQWGKQVRNKRNGHRLTQAALAERCGYTQKVISEIETGRYVLRAKVQLTLAVGLGAPVDELFAWPMGITELAASKVGR